MSESEKTAQAANQDNQIIMTPEEAVEKIARGHFRLKTPIADGEKSYDTLIYDFNALTSLELTRALDGGAGRGGSTGTLTNAQALGLFAAAAAKCTAGLDAHDIRERIDVADAIAAINVASLFFRSSLLAGGARITNE